MLTGVAAMCRHAREAKQRQRRCRTCTALHQERHDIPNRVALCPCTLAERSWLRGKGAFCISLMTNGQHWEFTYVVCGSFPSHLGAPLSCRLGDAVAWERWRFLSLGQATRSFSFLGRFSLLRNVAAGSLRRINSC